MVTAGSIALLSTGFLIPGFLVGAAGSIGWVLFGVRRRLFGLVALNIILIIFNLNGVYRLW